MATMWVYPPRRQAGQCDDSIGIRRKVSRRNVRYAFGIGDSVSGIGGKPAQRDAAIAAAAGGGVGAADGRCNGGSRCGLRFVCPQIYSGEGNTGVSVEIFVNVGKAAVGTRIDGGRAGLQTQIAGGGGGGIEIRLAHKEGIIGRLSTVQITGSGGIQPFNQAMGINRCPT